MLAEKAATLVQLVKQVVSNRTVDGQLVPLLERLNSCVPSSSSHFDRNSSSGCRVLDRVEAFMLKETAKGNVVKKIYRSVFVLQTKVEELSNELETEVRGFTVRKLAV